MDSRLDRPPRFAAPAAVVATALCWWFGTGLQPVWWLAWLAPLPLLAYAARARARWTALATLLAFAIGNANLWPYLHGTIRLPLPIALLAILLPALLMLPPVLLWRGLLRRDRPLAAMLALPLATTGLAWLSAATSPHGTFGHIAYTQMDALPVIQVAALAGLWGVGFLVWLLPSLLAVATASFATARKRIVAVAAGVVVLAMPLGYGLMRLHDDGADSSIRVGLLSIGGSDDVHADIDTPAGQRMLDAYVAGIDKLADRGARVIVAPESALLVRSHALASLQELATRRGVRILIGVEDHSDPGRKHNAALVFEPAGSAPASYFKRHLIPGFEDRYTPGAADAVLAGEPRTGMAICKDLDFTGTGLAHGRLGTRLLLVPAWDFGDDAWLHGRMAILRGVENGFAMARSARDGKLTLSDDRGRVLAQAATAGIEAPVALVGDVPLRGTRTLYARIGDAFGVLGLCIAALLAASLLRRRGAARR
jgi:apolipoprotein N-acyltransferase